MRTITVIVLCSCSTLQKTSDALCFYPFPATTIGLECFYPSPCHTVKRQHHRADFNVDLVERIFAQNLHHGDNLCSICRDSLGSKLCQ